MSEDSEHNHILFLNVIIISAELLYVTLYVALNFLAVAARGGMEALRPALQRVYMTRASAYRDGLKSFIQGYQEGIKEVMEKKEEYDSQQKEDSEKKGDIKKAS